MELRDKLKEVCKGFCINYEFIGYETIQMGHVNQTYRVDFRLPEGGIKHFLVQNVNTYAFRNPVGLMDNIDKVTEHIRKKNPSGCNLHFHHTQDRKTYISEGANFWRMTNYVPSVTYDTVKDLDTVRNAGKAFGHFQVQLADFDSQALIETIPNFHNTRSRYADFKTAIAEDSQGRASQVRTLIDTLLEMEDTACTLTDLYQAGKLPLRVTHNDTKINNVLFQPETGEALVVVDLDTVMPGLMGNDFGDAIRFAANTVAEDCQTPELAQVNLDVFKAFAQGFLSETGKRMEQSEIDTLAVSCFAMTVEVAIRFLGDYLNGDKYFSIAYPTHNLVRAACQAKLAADMLKKMDAMNTIVADCVQSLCK